MEHQSTEVAVFSNDSIHFPYVVHIEPEFDSSSDDLDSSSDGKVDHGESLEHLNAFLEV